MASPAQSEQPITKLLCLFLQLNLQGVTAHEYVDYVLNRYNLPNLSSWSLESMRHEWAYLERLKSDDEEREAFRINLLAYVPKGMRYI